MSLRDTNSINWTTPEAYLQDPSRPLLERLLAALSDWASAARAKLEDRRLARARWATAARGSPDIPEYLRQDLGLPPYGELPGEIQSMDLYR